MSLQKELLNLDTAVDKLSQGVNAIGLMTLGLVQMQHPYADSFYLLYSCMSEADRQVRSCLDACIKAV